MTDTASFPTEINEVDAMLAALHEMADEGTEEIEETSEHHEESGPGGEATAGESEEAAPEPPALAPPGTIEFEGQYLPIEDVRPRRPEREAEIRARHGPAGG